MLSQRPGVTSAPANSIGQLVLRQQIVQPTPGQILAITASGGDPAAVQRFIAQDSNLNAALPSQLAVSYAGQVITPTGSLATALPIPEPDSTGRDTAGRDNAGG